MLFLQQKEVFMENFSLIKKTQIFDGVEENDVQAMAHCFRIRFRNYNKNNVISPQGAPLEDVILLLKGSANIENMDATGSVSVLMNIKAGQCYGLVEACHGDEFYSSSLIASENCLVMLIAKHRLINPCENKCPRHLTVIKNIMHSLASRGMYFMDKINHLTKKKIREKVLSYLKSQSIRQNSTYFDIPYNKTELAEYLAVDRSALSSELSKMKAEGIIDFDKKHYHIKKDLDSI